MSATSSVTRYLDLDRFPATRDECVEMAAINNAPDELVEAISRLPGGLYETEHEIWILLKAQTGNG